MTTDFSNIKISKELQETAQLIIKAKMIYEDVKSKVEAIQLNIIKSNNFTNQFDDSRISTVADAWQMEEEQFIQYVELVKTEREKIGLLPEKQGCCPKLEAETNVRILKGQLLNQSNYIHGLNHQKFLTLGMDKYNQAVDLMLKAIITAPAKMLEK